MSKINVSKHRLVATVVQNAAPCSFCHQNINDEVRYGKLYAIGDLYCHYFCVLLSSCLIQKGEDEEGLLGFLYPDILAELERSKKHKCSYCHQEGATLGCAVTQCKKQFHHACGKKHNAVSLFYGNYKSYCSKHAPRQTITDADVLAKAKMRLANERKIKRNGLIEYNDSTAKNQETSDVCVICYEEVSGYPSLNTFWPPCCARDAWFHRECLERMALSAGKHYLKCPLCNDKEKFYRAVMSQGYYVPDRDAAWELEQNAFSDMYERQITCNAPECSCPNGRRYDSEEGIWDIRLCLLCGGGAHVGCGDRVCYICAPVAPLDLNSLEEKIANVILEEERAANAKRVARPIMPSRMSIRRTKPGASVRIKVRKEFDRIDEGMTQNIETPQEYQSILQTSREELNLSSPKKLINRQTNKQISKMDSPLKYLEEKLCEKTKGKESLNIIKWKEVLKKPRPLSVKRRIVNSILIKLMDDKPKPRSPLREWNSPKKIAEIENNYIETKSEETTNKEIDTTNIKIEKSISESLYNDESSNSTFQLPPEFIADEISDNDLPIFDTPKKSTTIEIQKKSIEISEQDQAVSIDLIEVESNDSKEFLKDLKLKSPVHNEKCSLKFSPTNKEILQSNHIGIEIEKFKNHYLNEVIKVEKENCEDTTRKLKRKRVSDKHKSNKKHKKSKKDRTFFETVEKPEKLDTEIDLQITTLNTKLIKKGKIKLKRDKRRYRMGKQEIKVKIKLNAEIKIKKAKKKKHKRSKDKNKVLKQTVLNFSPSPSKNTTLESDFKVFAKKRTKTEKSPDNYKQMSLHSFFSSAN